jgi:hypothetical protein
MSGMDKKGWLKQVLEEATKEVQTWPAWMRESEFGKNREEVQNVEKVLHLKEKTSQPGSRYKKEE